MSVLVFNVEPLVPTTVPGYATHLATNRVVIVRDTSNADKSPKPRGSAEFHVMLTSL